MDTWESLFNLESGDDEGTSMAPSTSQSDMFNLDKAFEPEIKQEKKQTGDFAQGAAHKTKSDDAVKSENEETAESPRKKARGVSSSPVTRSSAGVNQPVSPARREVAAPTTPGKRGYDESISTDVPETPSKSPAKGKQETPVTSTAKGVDDLNLSTPKEGSSAQKDEPRPYKCDVCDKAFARNHDLKRHSRIHLDDRDKPFGCPVCNKRFSRKDALNRHTVVRQCGLKQIHPGLKGDVIFNFEDPLSYQGATFVGGAGLSPTTPIKPQQTTPPQKTEYQFVDLTPHDKLAHHAAKRAASFSGSVGNPAHYMSPPRSAVGTSGLDPFLFQSFTTQEKQKVPGSSSSTELFSFDSPSMMGPSPGLASNWPFTNTAPSPVPQPRTVSSFMKTEAPQGSVQQSSFISEFGSHSRTQSLPSGIADIMHAGTFDQQYQRQGSIFQQDLLGVGSPAVPHSSVSHNAHRNLYPLQLGTRNLNPVPAPRTAIPLQVSGNPLESHFAQMSKSSDPHALGPIMGLDTSQFFASGSGVPELSPAVPRVDMHSQATGEWRMTDEGVNRRYGYSSNQCVRPNSSF